MIIPKPSEEWDPAPGDCRASRSPLQNPCRQKTLRQAASEAYDATLSNMHGYMVRMAIRTSMYMLPNRDQFLASINETGAPTPFPFVSSCEHNGSMCTALLGSPMGLKSRSSKLSPPFLLL